MSTSSSPVPRVRVVVLNWNAAWFTRRCLRSLAATDYPADALDVVLVDNGSIDGSLEQLRHSFPDVTIVENGENLGFAEGCNRAMRDRAGIDHIALINNDAVVEPGWLRALVDVIEAEADVGAVGARLVLDPGFVRLPVNATGPAVLASVELGGLDVTGSVRTDGFRSVPALDWPLDLAQHLDGSGTIWVPVGDADSELRVRFEGGPGVQVTVGSHAPVPAGTTAVLRAGTERVKLLNGIGTALNGLLEGFDLHLGEPDPGPGPATEVLGFCGGAALLRGAMLDDVGVFDPRYFAYYEDTDLSWRARRRGWRILAAPEAVVHHTLGASGGNRSSTFFFLDRRNWILTALRNGDTGQRMAVPAVVRRAIYKAFRANIFGRARRLQVPRVRLFMLWMRILVAVAVARPRVRRTRDRAVGRRPTSRVRSMFQPGGAPPRPRPRPGGPLVVHLDVTDTLRSGWHAGIQRVVRGLVRSLPDADERIELVPIVHAGNGQFRRVTRTEYAALLAPARPKAPAEDRPPTGGEARRVAMATADRVGAGDGLRRLRNRVVDPGPVEGAALLLPRIEPGTVFLDVDAVWNVEDLDHAALLSQLAESGVYVVPFVHDLLPVEHPDWFAPGLAAAFERTVRAQMSAASLVLTNSAATATALEEALAEGLLGVVGARPAPPVAALRLGTDVPVTAAAPAGGGVAGLPPGARYLLQVATIEPRKNHALALDVFERLAATRDDLHLVVVGRAGWEAEGTVQRLRRALEQPGSRIHWIERASDDDLDEIYRGAAVVVVPSLSEGHGLPVDEAVGRGVPVVTSGRGGLAELTSEAVVAVDPDDLEAWVRTVGRLLDDEAHRVVARSAAASSPPPAWADTARQLAALLVARYPRP